MRYAMQENLELKTIKYGASTITQQLVKNLYLNPSKNFLRKLDEAILTWRIEQTLSKKRILEIYLNVIEWGDGIFGIEQAARHYYHKSASDLSVHEAATLAAVLPSPLRYNPLSSSKFMTRRTNSILAKMGRRHVPLQQPAPVAATAPASIQTGLLNDPSVLATSVDIPDTADSVKQSDTAAAVAPF
jgi:monofunctional biosynthetic peptidoglycan transglycosylase